MHIVFIVGSYHPNYSAVGKCAGNIADELSKKHVITVICLKNDLDQNDEEIFNGQRILRVTTKENNIRHKLINKIKNSIGIKKRLNKFYYGLNKIAIILNMLLSKTSIKQDLVKSYINALENINETIDIIIPVSMPFESVVAAIQYKESHVDKIRVIPYLFDRFVDNINLHRFKFNKALKIKNHIKLENNIVERSDSILILKQLKSYYKEKYTDHIEKIYVVEHPLLKKIVSLSDRSHGKINFIYTGSFYKNIRNPKYMLNLFNKVLVRLDGTLNLYSFGNCKKIIDKYTLKNNRIINYGKVPTEITYEELNKNNFLVAVGNNDDKQVPSKIFEYLSYGKPIIYFYSNKKDKNLNVLNKYSLAICLYQDSNDDVNLDKLVQFCRKNINNKLSFEVVAEIFGDATPKYTADIIESIINRGEWI